MVNSYLLFYSEPKEKSPYQMADTFIGKHEVSKYRSVSIDWAGGGIVSTTEDLLLFHQALLKNALIKKETLELCAKDVGTFGWGMDYGYGILSLNVRKMTLVLPRMLDMWGNFGSVGAYMFYNPGYDIHIIGSFNHSRYAARQVPFLIGLIRQVSRQYRSSVQM
jgi:D-alanyl-D-alanine carboxypeptidase